MRGLFWTIFLTATGYMLALDGDFATRFAVLQQDSRAVAGHLFTLVEQIVSSDRPSFLQEHHRHGSFD